MLPDTTPVIEQIERLVADIPGWSPVDQLYTLYTLAVLSSNLGGDLLEVGSWCGRSTSVLGLAARRAGLTRLQCVDLFPAREDWRRNPDGSYSMSVTIDGRTYTSYDDQTVWAEPFERDIAPLYETHASILDVFRTTVARTGVADLVSAYRGTLQDFAASAAAASFRCRLAFIDGDHGYQAVRADIDTADRLLLQGGWLCLDDAFSSYLGVDQAITECILNNPRYELGHQMTRKLFVARKRRGS